MVDQPQAQSAPVQYLESTEVLLEMAEAGAKRSLSLSISQVMILSTMAGGFITVGALFSVLIATGTENEGLVRLLEGFGFSVGFFLVVLSGSLLFTEVNVELPATLLSRRGAGLSRGGAGLRRAVFRLWVLAALGNLLGTLIVGQIINYVTSYGPGYEELLGEVVETKLRFREIGGLDGFLRAVVSGILGNWLVGMAAFLATMGRTIIGKFIPVVLTVTAFVASGFMHSPANMGFLSLAQPLGAGPGWGEGLAWMIAPAALGNVIGAVVLVALPMWLANTRRQSVGNS